MDARPLRRARASSAPPATSPTSRSSRRWRRSSNKGKLDVPIIGVAKQGWNLDAAEAAGPRQPRRAGPGRRGRLRQAHRAAALRRRRLQRPRHVRGAAPGAGRRQAALPLPRHPAVAVRDGGQGPRRLRVRHERPDRRGEAVRPRPRQRRGAERHHPPLLPRGAASSGSTTSSARSRCRTCSTPASPTPSSSRSGTAPTSTTCRSRWPRTFDVDGPRPLLRRHRAASATSSRTTCCR